MTESYRGWRLLWGGSGPEGMDPRFVRRFIELAGGVREAHIAVVPTASEERADTIARYQESSSSRACGVWTFWTSVSGPQRTSPRCSRS